MLFTNHIVAWVHSYMAAVARNAVSALWEGWDSAFRDTVKDNRPVAVGRVSVRWSQRAPDVAPNVAVFVLFLAGNSLPLCFISGCRGRCVLSKICCLGTW